MAGFLGDQIILSSETAGAEAGDYSTITLKNGTVITGYMGARGGPLNFYSYKPGTDTKEFVTQIFAGGTVSLVATPDGGFKAFLHDASGTQTGTAGIVQYRFDAAGAQIGSAKTIIKGTLATDTWSASETSKGYVITYYDQDAGETGFKAAFYTAKGKLQNTVELDMDPGLAASNTVRAVELANGNTVVSWAEGITQDSYFQIVKANGTPAGNKVAIHLSTTGGIAGFDVEIASNPDGGFAAVRTMPGDRQTLLIQQYTNNGTPKGDLISFDARVLGARQDLAFGDMKIEYLANGAMALAWAGLPTDFGNQYDVFFAVISKAGTVIVGPQLAGQRVADFQEDVGFTTLKNGDLLLTFRDDGFKNFGYQDSIQARLIVQPDQIWEGNGKANAKVGSNGNDVLLGVGGNDSIDGGKGADFIKGGKGNDKLFGGDKDDDLQGESGADLIYGGKGADTLDGATGGDTLYGDQGDDRITGDDGNDKIYGGSGIDLLYGGTGKDLINAGTDGGTAYGGEGNDKLNGGSGRDNLFGDQGNDRIKGADGDDYLKGDLGKDKLYGGTGNDVLNGDGDNDLLKGGSGDDFIFSGDGNDREYGDAGSDNFYDSLGNDTMFGGGDADTFNFIGVEFGRDTIKDFEFGVDTLDMGLAAYALELASVPAIKIKEVANGVRFEIDADNWVLVKDAVLTDFQVGDYITDSPF